MHDITQQASSTRPDDRTRVQPAAIPVSDHMAKLGELASKAAQTLRTALEHAEVQARLDRNMIEHLEHQLREQEALIRELCDKIAELEGGDPWKT